MTEGNNTYMEGSEYVSIHTFITLYCFEKEMTIDLVSYRLAISIAFVSPMYTLMSIRKLLHD